MEGTVKLKSMTRSQLAAKYRVNIKTFNRWILPHEDKIGKIHGKILTPLQVQRVIEALGEW